MYDTISTRYKGNTIKKILIIMLLYSICANVYADSLLGLWIWDKNSKKHSFSITIKKSGNSYIGTYCAIGMSGNRIDCSTKYPKSFPFTTDESIFTFTTNYSNTKGIGRIQLVDNNLLWEVLSQPSGEHYAPKIAKLNKYIDDKKVLSK